MAVLFWIAIWHILSMQKILGIFLASPWQTVCRFAELCGTLAFWRSLLYTSGRILAGFLLAAAVGTLLASLTGKSPLLDVFLMPVMRLVRTVPVVSFIILALILVSSKYLTQLIAFIMALPIIYMNVRTGIATTDRKLTEMAVN